MSTTNKLILSESEELEVLKRIKEENRRNILRRLKAIRGRHMQHKNKDVAGKLDVSEQTVCNRVKIYREDWLEWLCNPKYSERRKSRLEDIEWEIKDKIEEDTVNTLSELSDWIEKKFWFYPEESRLWRRCKKKHLTLV